MRVWETGRSRDGLNSDGVARFRYKGERFWRSGGGGAWRDVAGSGVGVRGARRGGERREGAWREMCRGQRRGVAWREAWWAAARGCVARDV
jgi:hypothetical protein